MKKMHEVLASEESATVLINTLAQQKNDAGVKVYNLSAGEPKLPPHPLIIQAVEEALKAGKTFYPPVSGIPELRLLASEWMNNAYACQFQPDNCLVVNGGKFGIYLLLQLLLQKEDEVIIAAPYWVSYPAITRLFQGIPVIMDTCEAEGWKLTEASLRQACTAKSRILILNNAANPTGVLYTKEELEILLSVAKEHDLLVISDEVYSGLTYEGHRYVSAGQFPEHQERVVIIQSCSKNFSMTGWRIGFVFAPTNLIKKLTSLVSQSTSGVTTISQWAAIAAFKQVKTINDWVRESMQIRRDVLCQAINDAFGLSIAVPHSSLYLFIGLQQLGYKAQSSTAFCQQMLDQANVALVPGIAFGQEGYVRFSFGAGEDDLVMGVRTLAERMLEVR